MNILALKGTQIKFSACGGHDYEIKEAKNILELNKVYTLENSVVHDFSTEFYLEGFEQPFNSCLFEEVNHLN